MSKIRLTQRSVEQAKCPSGRRDVLVFDSDLVGFGLRVTTAGGKSFLVQYRAFGRLRRMSVGKFGVLTVEQARSEAKRLLGMVAAGGDPLAAKEHEVARVQEIARAAEAQAAADAFTLDVLVTRWMAARAGDRRESYLDEAGRCIRRNLPGLVGRPAARITAQETALAIDGIGKNKGVVAANRTLAYARAAYSWALRRQVVAINPFKDIEGAGREQSRERVLDGRELGAIWRACEGLDPYPAAFVRLLMLTLGRRDEVASMRWCEISGDHATWTLPRERSKNHRTHVVALPEAAREIIGALPRISSSPFLFPSRDPARPAASFSSIKASLQAELAKRGSEIPDWRFHDFRRAGVSTLAGLGVAPHVADRLLNHVTGAIQGVAAVYQRHAFAAERAAALETWAGFVLVHAEGRASADNVIQLRA